MCLGGGSGRSVNRNDPKVQEWLRQLPAANSGGQNSMDGTGRPQGVLEVDVNPGLKKFLDDAAKTVKPVVKNPTNTGPRGNTEIEPSVTPRTTTRKKPKKPTTTRARTLPIARLRDGFYSDPRGAFGERYNDRPGVLRFGSTGTYSTGARTFG